MIGTTDLNTTTAFFRDELGFKASDYIKAHGAIGLDQSSNRLADERDHRHR
ncbi:hypothetical protein [Streptomyces sp. NPDC005538]|uniref:hypothetical protein n=1 Tax=unclassified Streptomyces TaxID=2593676 RepID=UPI0033B14EC5